MKKSVLKDKLFDKNIEFQRSWVKFIELIIEIKEKKLYKKEFEYKSFKEFIEKQLGYLRQTIYKMIRAYKFIKENMSQLLNEKLKLYIPPYGYIVHIFSKKLNDKQKKRLEKLIFSGGTKKQILLLKRQFIKENMTQPEKIKKELRTVMNFAKSFNKALFKIKDASYVKPYITFKIKKVLDDFKEILYDDLLDIQNSILNSKA